MPSVAEIVAKCVSNACSKYLQVSDNVSVKLWNSKESGDVLRRISSSKDRISFVSKFKLFPRSKVESTRFIACLISGETREFYIIVEQKFGDNISRSVVSVTCNDSAELDNVIGASIGGLLSAIDFLRTLVSKIDVVGSAQRSKPAYVKRNYDSKGQKQQADQRNPSADLNSDDEASADDISW